MPWIRHRGSPRRWPALAWTGSFIPSLTVGAEPLDLAARAENSLALVGDPLGPPVTGLLD